MFLTNINTHYIPEGFTSEQFKYQKMTKNAKLCCRKRKLIHMKGKIWVLVIREASDVLWCFLSYFLQMSPLIHTSVPCAVHSENNLSSENQCILDGIVNYRNFIEISQGKSHFDQRCYTNILLSRSRHSSKIIALKMPASLNRNKQNVYLITY